MAYEKLEVYFGGARHTQHASRLTSGFADRNVQQGVRCTALFYGCATVVLRLF